jgi:hypothetical protein
MSLPVFGRHDARDSYRLVSTTNPWTPSSRAAIRTARLFVPLVVSRPPAVRHHQRQAVLLNTLPAPAPRGACESHWSKPGTVADSRHGCPRAPHCRCAAHWAAGGGPLRGSTEDGELQSLRSCDRHAPHIAILWPSPSRAGTSGGCRRCGCRPRALLAVAAIQSSAVAVAAFLQSASIPQSQLAAASVCQGFRCRMPTVRVRATRSSAAWRHDRSRASRVVTYRPRSSLTNGQRRTRPTAGADGTDCSRSSALALVHEPIP